MWNKSSKYINYSSNYVMGYIERWRDKGLKRKKSKLVEVVKKKEEEKRIFENKNKELLKKNKTLAENFLGKLQVQGAKHIIWDMIITEATKMRPYLNLIKYK